MVSFVFAFNYGNIEGGNGRDFHNASTCRGTNGPDKHCRDGHKQTSNGSGVRDCSRRRWWFARQGALKVNLPWKAAPYLHIANGRKRKINHMWLSMTEHERKTPSQVFTEQKCSWPVRLFPNINWSRQLTWSQCFKENKKYCPSDTAYGQRSRSLPVTAHNPTTLRSDQWESLQAISQNLQICYSLLCVSWRKEYWATSKWSGRSFNRQSS